MSKETESQNSVAYMKGFDDGRLAAVVELRRLDAEVKTLKGELALWQNPNRSVIREMAALAAENKTLRDALDGVLPWVVTQEVACQGMKCREPVCMSCNSDSEEAAERASTAYQAAREALKGETK